MYKLPVWNTIGTCYRSIWAERLSWLMIALLITGISVAKPFLSLVSNLGLPVVIELIADGRLDVASPELARPEPVWPIAYGVLSALVIALIVTRHEHYLLGRSEQLFAGNLGYREFFKRSLVIGVAGFFLFYVVGAVVVGIGEPLVGLYSDNPKKMFYIWPVIALSILGLIVLVVLLVLLTRLFPALPAAAIRDANVTLGKSFALTRGNGFRLTGILLFGALLPFWGIWFLFVTAIFGIAMRVQEDPLLASIDFGSSATMHLVFPILSEFFWMLGIAVAVLLNSASYRLLRGNVSLDQETPVA